MQPGSAVQVFTHGRWREATVEASEEGAFAVLHAGDNQISAGCENIPHGSDKIRWPNAPPRTCSWSKISDLEESCPPVLLKATSELQPCCLDQNEVKRLLQVVMNCCSVSPTMKRI